MVYTDMPPRPLPVTPVGSAAHLQIRAWLVAALAAGDFAVGERLPPERELAIAFGVSRMTLRHALDELEREGALERRVGRAGGTFVAEARLELHGLSTLSHELRGLGVRTGARVLKALERTAGAGEVAVLGDGPVLAIERLRYANGGVLALERIALSAGPFPGLLERPLTGSIDALLRREYAVFPVRAVEHLAPTTARASEAEALEVAVGAPLLLVRRVSSDASGRPLELSHDLYRGDRLRVSWTSELPEPGHERAPGPAGPPSSARGAG